MKTLIIPDIHNRIDQVSRILNSVPHDRRIFLGDFFDSKGDGAYEARRTALWLRPILEDTMTQVVFGNHDFAYWMPSWGYTWCPGFTQEKSKVIREVIPRALWEQKFNFVWFEQDWAISHAGFHPEALPCYPGLALDQAYIARAADEAFDYALRLRMHPLLEQGESMGQANKRSGCMWLRWNEFLPISGVNQIVGHTLNSADGRILNKVREKHLTEEGTIVATGDQNLSTINPVSSNFNLDTENRYYGILEDGIFSYTELDSGITITPVQPKFALMA